MLRMRNPPPKRWTRLDLIKNIWIIYLFVFCWLSTFPPSWFCLSILFSAGGEGREDVCNWYWHRSSRSEGSFEEGVWRAPKSVGRLLCCSDGSDQAVTDKWEKLEQGEDGASGTFQSGEEPVGAEASWCPEQGNTGQSKGTLMSLVITVNIKGPLTKCLDLIYKGCLD